MNGLIHYLWKSGLLKGKELTTTDCSCLRIVDTGKSNNTGTLFKEAKVKIGEQTWCGDVMLHHDNPKKTKAAADNNSVILHVMTDSSTKAPQSIDNGASVVINCPQELLHEFQNAEQHAATFPCAKAIATLPEIQYHGILSRLLTERIGEKMKIIERIFAQCDQRWDDTLLKVAIRSFGFGIQSSVFEEWATLLNPQALGKHRDNPVQVEAILFGQAGLLDEESIPSYYKDEALRSTYYNELKREYRFLSNKFGLESIDNKKWNCGNSTPHLRIARIASLYSLGRLTMSGITAVNTLTDAYKLFSHPLSGYWHNHTCFGGTETIGNSGMRQKQVDVIIINTVAPMLYVYGKHRKEEKLCSMAEDLLHQIAPEENSIIKRWREQGVKAGCAADTQALLQLERSYCRVRNCTECPFAYHYIKGKIEEIL